MNTPLPKTPPDAGVATPSPAPPGGQRVFATKTEMDAATVRELLLPGCLASIVGTGSLSHAGIKAAFDQILQEAGDPKDPIERMLVEQLLLVHHRLAILHAQASEAKGIEATKILNGAATRLQAEFRKSALALRDYRLPPSRKSVAFIRQQNVAAAGGHQQVEYRDQEPKASLSGQGEVNKAGDDLPEEDLHARRERLARRQQSAPEPTAAALDTGGPG